MNILLAILAATILTAPKGKIYNDDPVVTNITFEGLATTNDLATCLNNAKDTALLAVYYPEGNVTSVSQITTEGIEYAIGEDADGKYAYIVNGTSATGNIVIPWKIEKNGEEYMVAHIAEKAFEGNTNITSVIAATTLVGRPKAADKYYDRQYAVGWKAFYECSALETISFPGVIAGGFCYDEAFAYCKSLTSISLPRCAGRFGGYAFSNCTALETVEFPLVKAIGYGTFEECKALKNVSFPKAERSGSDIFQNCTNLASITFPSSFTLFEDSSNIFVGCKSLSIVDFSRCTQIVQCRGGVHAFAGVPTTCKIIVPLGMYDEWIAAPGWCDLYAAGYNFVGLANAADLAAVTSTIPETVTNVVRDTQGLVYDEKLGITWKQTMYDGNLYYIAVTNANITEVKE